MQERDSEPHSTAMSAPSDRGEAQRQGEQGNNGTGIEPTTFIGQAWQGAWTLVRSDPVALLLGGSLAALLGSLTFGILAGPLAWGVFAMCWKRLREGQPMRIGDIFQQFERVLTSIGLVFLGGLLVLIGFALLIVPGLYLSVAFMYSLPLALDRRTGIWRALGLSRRLVHRTGFWAHALLLLSLVVPALFIGGGSLGLLSLLWAAFSMAVVAVAYDGWLRPVVAQDAPLGQG